MSFIMERRVLAHKSFFKAISPKCCRTTANRKNLLKKANLKQIKCLCECALNIAKGNIPLRQSAYKKFKQNKKLLHNLAFQKIPLKHKKQLLIQKGSGFFVPLLVSVIGQALSQLLKK